MNSIQKTLLVVLLALGQPCFCPDAFSGQKMAPLAPLGEMQTNAMSPREVELARYIKEKEQLLRDQKKSSAPYLVKNKVKILDNKINFLQQQLRLQRPRTVASAPRKVAVKSSKAVLKKIPATPVILKLKLKPFAPMEPRHRIYLAMIAQKVDAQPLAPIERREEGEQAQPAALMEKRAISEQGILPLKVTFPGTFEKPAPRSAPERMAEPQRNVQAQPPAHLEKRAAGERGVLPLKVELPGTFEKPAPRSAPERMTEPQRNVQTQPSAHLEKRAAGERGVLPLKVELPGTFEKPAPRMPSETHAVTVPETPALKAVLPPVAPMKGVKTGADWMTMSRADKEIYVLSVMGNLSRRDVFLEKSYNFYIDELDRQLKSGSGLEKEYVHHLLLKSAFENEPECRKDIEKVWK